MEQTQRSVARRQHCRPGFEAVVERSLDVTRNFEKEKGEEAQNERASYCLLGYHTMQVESVDRKERLFVVEAARAVASDVCTQ